MQLMNFEPFIDYEGATPEMARDLHAALREHKDATRDFVADDEPDLGKAARLIEASHRTHCTLTAIIEALHTTPVMVHVAGPIQHETDPDDGDEHVIQRCTRCGSVLNFFRERFLVLDPHTGPRPMEEDDVPWWDEGTLVAKANSSDGVGMYEIETDRSLDKHERECADLTILEG